MARFTFKQTAVIIFEIKISLYFLSAFVTRYDNSKHMYFNCKNFLETINCPTWIKFNKIDTQIVYYDTNKALSCALDRTC